MERLLDNSGSLGLEPFYDDLKPLVMRKRRDLDNPKGNALVYRKALDRLPWITPDRVTLDTDAVSAGSPDQLTADQMEDLCQGLMELSPWRKGPFRLFGLDVDAEWRSCLKWDRVEEQMSPLAGIRILDIGSSNGYYMFRMAARHPAMVLGVEPQLTFYYQFLALQRYLGIPCLYGLPVTFDELPMMAGFFDRVFCMGILSHRRSPLAMLKRIREMMKPGGELVVENLVIEGDGPLCLFPETRYAKMRNVFFIPTVSALTAWLTRTGFGEVRCVDQARTTSLEQRKTRWIRTESLADFLDPEDPLKTVEGHPSPVRAILMARAR